MSQLTPPLLHRALLACACAGLAACANTPRLDARFGQSMQQLKAQQVLYPQAAVSTNPVAGIDGKVGEAVYQQYQKSFTEQASDQNAFTIGIGGKR